MQRLARCHLHIDSRSIAAASESVGRAATEARWEAVVKIPRDDTQSALQKAQWVEKPQSSHIRSSTRPGIQEAAALQTNHSKDPSTHPSPSTRHRRKVQPSLSGVSRGVFTETTSSDSNDVEFGQEALQIYRHLLRAVTYFPDDFARTYLRNHIDHLFRKPQSRGQKTLQEIDGRRKRHLKNALRGISMLQRAVEGEADPLLHILRDVYGRSGPRRREFVAQIHRPENSPLLRTHEDIQAALDGGIDLDDRQAHPALQALLKSQRANNIEEYTRGKIRITNPDDAIPKENIFGRPLAKKLLAGKTRRFWAEVLDKIHPPLPEPEWNRLRDLSTGAIKFEGVRPRRMLGLTTAQIENRTIEGTREHAPERWEATKPAEQSVSESAMQIKPDKVTQETRTGVSLKIRQSLRIPGTNEQGDITAETFDKHYSDLSPTEWLSPPQNSLGRPIENRHILTASYMRRAWQHVWLLSPLLSYSVEKKKWGVTWGGRTALSNRKVSEPGTTDLELFEGLLGRPMKDGSGVQYIKDKETKRKERMERKMRASATLQTRFPGEMRFVRKVAGNR